MEQAQLAFCETNTEECTVVLFDGSKSQNCPSCGKFGRFKGREEPKTTSEGGWAPGPEF